MFTALALLLLAIAAEVAATSALPRTDGFRDVGWSAAVLAGYAVSIWLLAIVVRTLPVSTSYAIWSGVGTAAIAVIGAVWLSEGWDAVKILAVAMVVTGVVILNVHGAH